MKVFHSGNNELRVGWKVLRVLLLVVALTAAFAALARLLKIEALGDYAVHLAMICGALLGLRLERKPLSHIGIRLRDSAFWIDLLWGLAWGALLIGLVVGGMVFITGEMSAGQFWAGTTISGLAYSFVGWLVVAAGEESLFRGYILSMLRQRMRLWAALAVSAGIFGAIHIINPDYYWFAFVYAILIGVGLGGVVVKRGNLGGAIGFHHAWNLLQDKGILNTPARGGEAFFAIILLAMGALVFRVLPGRPLHDEESNGKAPTRA